MHRFAATLLLVSTVAFGGACSGCDSPTGTRGPSTDADEPDDGAVVDAHDARPDDADTTGEDGDARSTDGTAVDGDEGDPSDADARTDGATCADTATFCDGTCVDLQDDDDHCGDCGNTCEDQETCSDGRCVGCSGTKTRCNGECVATKTQPDHCGACGNSCESNEVCSSGRCVDDCLSGRTACGRECVDLEDDDDHCGECGRSCGGDEGCVNGKCVDRIPVDEAPDACSDGGDPIDYRDRDRRRCAGRTASRVFRWAICSCSTIQTDDPLVTDAFDSGVAPYEPGGLGGGVGANESISTDSPSEIRGAVWAAGDAGVAMGGATDVSLELHSDGPVSADDPLAVRDDAYVDGAVTGNVDVEGTLTTSPGSMIGGSVTATRQSEAPVDVPRTCRRCGPNERLPVGAIVGNHGSPNNDNDEAGVAENALSKSYDDPRRIDLPCGEYYFDAIGTSGTLTVVTHGHTALFVDGDVTADGSLTIKPSPGSTLDIFIAGDVAIDNGANFGSPAYPAATRVYIGGPNGLSFDDASRIGANVYAVPGGVASGGDAEFFGSIYASELSTDGELAVHYDRNVLEADRECEPPSDGGGNGDAGMDAGDGTSSGGDTMDGGTGGTDGSGTSDTADAGSGGNVCGDQGDGCTGDDECCSPLVCHKQSCQLLECRALGESCDAPEECCSGSCASSVCVSG